MITNNNNDFNVGYTLREIKMKVRNSNEEIVKEELINTLIRQRFSQSEVEAINSNYLQYLTDYHNTRYKEEWLAFNSYRAEVKEFVRNLMLQATTM